MTILMPGVKTYAIVIGSMPKKATRLHATDPNDVFAPLCGTYYTTAQTVAVAGGLHAAPLSCPRCMALAPYPYPTIGKSQ